MNQRPSTPLSSSSPRQRPSLVAFSGNPVPSPPGKGLILLIMLTVFICSIVFGGGIWFVRELYHSLPTVGKLRNIQQSLVSRVEGFDGTIIHDFSIERRFWVPLDSIPDDLVKGVISIEDRRFYEHWGTDLRRIFGAIIIDLLHGGYKQGASTITQQLARNVYLTATQSMVRKVREILTAVQLESYYTKNEIMELYLNQVYLGAGVYGVQAASQKYFSKNVWQLSTNECAVLAGTIQLPEHYRPDKDVNIKRAQGRRNAVLGAMRDMKFLSRSTADSLRKSEIPRNPQKNTVRIGPYFLEMVRQSVLNKYGDNTLYNGGLTIRTTLDPVAQQAAEKAVAEQLVDLQGRCNRIFLDMSRAYSKLKIPKDTFAAHFDSLYALHRSEYEALPDSVQLRIAQVALVALDARTGEIRALVGGRHFEESKFNRATQAYRQPGSAFKPIVYAAALEHGFTSVTQILDQPITLQTPEGEWRPENYDNKFYGRIPLRTALARSVNLPAIQVLLQVGADTVVQYAHALGITTPLAAVPSLAMGSCEVLPIELITAYGAFGNGGYLVKPFFINNVSDRNGRMLDENTPRIRRVLDPKTAFLMADMMNDVICCGTGAAIPGMGFTRMSGGKTGTTNRYSDAWFIGFTPQIVCGVWVGIDEQKTLGAGVTGAQAAIPIWVKTMIALHRDLPEEGFHRPDSIITETICVASSKIATHGCPEVRHRYFVEGSMSDTCDVHSTRSGRSSGDAHRMFGGQKKKPDARKKQRTF